MPTVVVLRAFRVDDTVGLRTLAADPATALWNTAPTPEHLDGWWARMNEAGEDWCAHAVADPADDRLLGTVSVFAIDADQGLGEIGYRVLPAERGRGVATAAVRALAAQVFLERGLERLTLLHAVGNAASCRVAARAGFAIEGTTRSSYRYGDGLRHDEHVHGRLRDDPPAGAGPV